MRCSARRHRRLLRHVLHLSAGTCGLGVVANECTQTKECKHCGGIMVSNMRVCQHCRSLNTSTWPFRGVKGKKRQHDDMVWQAFIWHDRKNEYIGTFLFPEEAAAAYDKRARVRRQPPRHHDALAPLYSPSLISRVAPITLPTMYHPCVRCRVI